MSMWDGSFPKSEEASRAVEQVEDLQVGLKGLHQNPELTAQDRAQVMIANDILRNLSPFRAARSQMLREPLQQDEATEHPT